MERCVKFFEHLVALEFVGRDVVKMRFNACCKAVVDDLIEVRAQEVTDELSSGGWHELAFVAPGFFLHDFTIYLAVK